MPYRSPLLPDRYPQQDLFVCSHILHTAYLSEIEYTFLDCQMIKSRGRTTKSKTNRQLSIDRWAGYIGLWLIVFRVWSHPRHRLVLKRTNTRMLPRPTRCIFGNSCPPNNQIFILIWLSGFRCLMTKPLKRAIYIRSYLAKHSADNHSSADFHIHFLAT